MSQDETTGQGRGEALARRRAEVAGRFAAGDRAGAAEGLGTLGGAVSAAGHKARAALLLESALTLHRALGDGWGAFLDLVAQGEALLSLPGRLPSALGCFAEAIEIGRAIEAPGTEEAEVRAEVILRLLADRFPGKDQAIRARLEEDPEAVRLEGVEALLEDSGDAAAFFDQQLAVAGLLAEPGGVVSSLGSLSQVLAEAGEARGAAAALAEARAELEAMEGGPRAALAAMLEDWRAGLEAAPSGPSAIDEVLPLASADLERVRAAATSRLSGEEPLGRRKLGPGGSM